MNELLPSRINSLQFTANLFGVHRNTLSAWIRDGAPVVERADRSRGKEWKIDTAALSDWLIARAVRDAVSRR